MKSTFLAHIKQVPETGEWQEHTLAEHSLSVAKLAKQFAIEFNSGDIAWILGLYHDLGKATSDFQQYIRKSSGYQTDIPYAIIGRQEKRHAITGALYLIARLATERGCTPHHLKQQPFSHLLTHPIAGHHAGLPDWNTPGDRGSLQQQFTDYDFLLFKLDWEHPAFPCEFSETNLKKINLSMFKKAHSPLLGRFLFSSLVDADFLDTERFFDAEQTQSRHCSIELPDLREAMDGYLSTLMTSATLEQSPLAQLRESILFLCRKNALQAPGLFSLTVPTGGGKTLSSMAFALNHALTHGKHRVIYVIPYTSIIEQTAGVFRKAFGKNLAHAVLEHHSNLDTSDNRVPELDESLGQTGYRTDTANNRLATENWDWPIIVTTNVQFFESLFAAKPSRCRKLHNIANSVVVLDEVQMLPPDFLGPICLTLQELAECYGVTAILMTATQPALNAENFKSSDVCKGLRNVREIMDAPHVLAEQFQGRVVLSLPDDLEAEISIDVLADRLVSENAESWLCIVNTRLAARKLYQRMCEMGMEDGLFHLSTQLCGKHRQHVIDEIRARLSRNEITRVISTQLVEAGVDLDFPKVYRALSGLDSLAQAAGRCNREGGLPEPGRVEVFVLEKNSPRGHLQQAEAICRQILHECKAMEREPLSLWAFERYFQELFWSKGSVLDKKGIARSEAEWAYRTVARDFQMVPEAGINLIVPYDDVSIELIQEILAAVKPDFRWHRRAQRYLVAIPEPVMKQALIEGMVVRKFEDLHLLLPNTLYYDAQLGFLPPGSIAQNVLDNALIS